MDQLHLSFGMSFSEAGDFLDYWAKYYPDAYTDPEGYDRHIGVSDLREWGPLKALFEWKNGGKIAERKLESIRKNYFADWTEDSRLEERYLSPQQQGGPIWNIFYLHCRKPNDFPIFDQHTYRAMRYMREGTIYETFSSSAPGFIYQCYEDYRKFVAATRSCTGRDWRTIDRALFTFGQFLKLAMPYSARRG